MNACISSQVYFNTNLYTHARAHIHTQTNARTRTHTSQVYFNTNLHINLNGENIVSCVLGVSSTSHFTCVAKYWLTHS